MSSAVPRPQRDVGPASRIIARQIGVGVDDASKSTSTKAETTSSTKSGEVASK